MTVIEALQWANNKLRKSDIDSPMLDAELLLAHVLGVGKTWLFAHFNDPVKTHHQEAFHILIDRRSEREPIAYLTGKREFYKCDFTVNRFVLIPRPETETLIDAVLSIVNESDPERVLLTDIGTGSGAIAVTLAAETELLVIASDIDAQALLVARENAKSHEVADKIDFQHGNLAEPLIRIFKTLRNQPGASSVHPFKHLVIAANLPYLPERRLEQTEPEVQNYEPHHALISGKDGLDAYWELFRSLRDNRRLLPRQVTILIEIDPEQREATESLIRHNFPSADPVAHKDLLGLDRVIVAQL